ncbi:MAG TPA: ABC transporter ATP-binding protein [bacterium]|nr:ABC transporter ATP-binding protein [bacterium]
MARALEPSPFLRPRPTDPLAGSAFDGALLHTLHLGGQPVSPDLAQDYALILHDLTKRFGDFVAVDHIHLALPRGTFLGFLGPNGAGKSTTINMAIGLLRPSSGQVWVNGHNTAIHPLASKASLGVIPEHLALYDRLTAWEQVEFTGRIFGVDPTVVTQRAHELVELLELDPRKYVGDLSLGMRKKVALASALVHDPPVLMLDEPFNGIDAVSARNIKEILRTLTRRGTTIVLTTHVMEQIEQLCDHVAVINHGHILASGTMAAFREAMAARGYDSLEHAFVALLGRDEPGKELSWIKSHA